MAWSSIKNGILLFFIFSFNIITNLANNTVIKENIDQKESSKQQVEKKSSSDIEKKTEDKKEIKSEDKKAEDKKAEDKKDKKDFKKLPLACLAEDSEYRFFFKLRLPEFFYGKNLRLLNDCNPEDRVVYFRHTLDLNIEYKYGAASRGYDVILGMMTLRTKGVWGDTESIGYTTETEIKELDVVFGNHKHAIPRHFIWLRELWIQLSLADVLTIPFKNYHTLTFGAFPFQLGRGIALGSSYAVDPTDLGFYSENAIDQYAWAAKLTGDIFTKKLSYDMYASILDNQSASFANTSANIRGQQYGHRNYQERGFGIINYLIAGRFQYFPVTCDGIKTKIEPYGLYNHNPQQRVDVREDAVSDLVTLGMAGEFELGKFEFGFDTAYNFGNQKVYGIDRNNIRHENRDGHVVIVNSNVHQAQDIDASTDIDRLPLALKVPENQRIIETSTESIVENGRVIGENHLGKLVNGHFRFRNPYVNTYHGRMAVFDMSYNIITDLKASIGIGYASGDENPNRDINERRDSERDTAHQGFIGLQETYSGTRIRSAFLLSGSGRIPRLLAFPIGNQVRNTFPTTLTRFSNLYFIGSSLKWLACKETKRWNINPNVLAYWQDISTRLRASTRTDVRTANPFLGTELNCFAEAVFLPDLRFFSICSIFIPGQHYKEIKGLPLNREQQRFLDNKDKTGINNNFVPTLGDDVAFFLNLGLEYRF